MSIISRIKEAVFPRQKGVKSMIYGILAGLAAVFGLALIVIGVGIYKYNWQGAFIQKTVKIFPYPAVRVNWHFLSYADYLEEVGVLTNFYAKQTQETGSPAISDKEIRQRVMDRQIRNEFFQQLAEKDGLAVTGVDVEVAWQSMVKASGSTEEEINKMVQDLYGWTPAVFKEKIIRPSLVEEKEKAKITQAEDYDQASKQKAEEVFNLVKEGKTDFAELAKQYSEDPGSAPNGGDLGYFAKGVMVPEFERAVFALEPGQTSELVKSQFGYHIIKLADKRTNEAGEEEVQASHILIMSRDFDEYYLELLQEETVKEYIKI